MIAGQKTKHGKPMPGRRWLPFRCPRSIGATYACVRVPGRDASDSTSCRAGCQPNDRLNGLAADEFGALWSVSDGQRLTSGAHELSICTVQQTLYSGQGEGRGGRNHTPTCGPASTRRACTSPHHQHNKISFTLSLLSASSKGFAQEHVDTM